MNKLEIDGRIYKKRRVEMLHFLLILFPRTVRKMMDHTEWKEFINLSNYLKQSKNQNLLQTRSWKYSKRNTKHASDKYEKFYETTNVQSGQINATAGERHFQRQNRNNLTVENNTRERKDITLSQTQNEGLQNEETQQHRDIENRSIIKIENQFIQFRQKQQEKFKQIKNPLISPNSNENLQKWSRDNSVIVGDSMVSGIDERISKKIERLKLKTFQELRSMACMIISSHC